MFVFICAKFVPGAFEDICGAHSLQDITRHALTLQYQKWIKVYGINACR